LIGFVAEVEMVAEDDVDNGGGGTTLIRGVHEETAECGMAGAGDGGDRRGKPGSVGEGKRCRRGGMQRLKEVDKWDLKRKGAVPADGQLWGEGVEEDGCDKAEKENEKGSDAKAAAMNGADEAVWNEIAVCAVSR
jgi:hypothetical protein